MHAWLCVFVAETRQQGDYNSNFDGRPGQRNDESTASCFMAFASRKRFRSLIVKQYATRVQTFILCCLLVTDSGSYEYY